MSKKNKLSFKVGNMQRRKVIITSFVCVLLIAIVIFCISSLFKNDENNNGGVKTDNEKLSKYYDVYKVSKKPIKEGIKINGNKIDLDFNYYSIKFKEIHKLNDVFIVEFEALFTKEDDTYNGVLYAISSEGKVLWYEIPHYLCKDDNKLCRGVIGYHFTEDFGYRGQYYKISDNKITFVSEVLTQVPLDEACSMDRTDDFTVEYEIDYLGNNEFSELKKIRSLTAGEYIDRERNNGVDVQCN